MIPRCYSYKRFSTPEQSKGDSLRRQTELSEKYAHEHGLILDDMLDLGLSAFKGGNRAKGTALGRFLDCVHSGKISKGSTLLVESLDRLSREQVTDAYDLFREITKAGVKIVTLSDGMTYTKESVDNNFGQLMYSLMIMSRANEESATKSKRLKASWSNKRDKIHDTKLTARAPAWLKLSNDRKSYIVMPERAEIIRHIFTEKINGKGSRQIAIELNAKAAWLPNTQKRNGGPPEWRESYIQKILRSTAVIGDYQPHQKIFNNDNKSTRQPVGDIAKGYFPAIVPESLFYAVQERIKQDILKAGNGGGRTGKISNLFGYIAKCGYCGASMAFIDKGKKPKGGKYLVCDAARRGVGNCYKYFVRYDEFEKLILTYCKGLNVADILQSTDEAESILESFNGNLYSSESEVKEITFKINNLLDQISLTSNPKVRFALEDRLAQELEKQVAVKQKINELTAEINRIKHERITLENNIESINTLFSQLSDHEGEQLINIRRRIREKLRSLIDEIRIFPVGIVPMTYELANETLKELVELNPEMMLNGDYEKFDNDLKNKVSNTKLRLYRIHFKGRSFRTIEPEAQNTLRIDFDFEQGVMRNWFKGKNGETDCWEFKKTAIKPHTS